MLLRMLTATTKMTPMTSQQSSTHQPLSLTAAATVNAAAVSATCDVCLIAPRDGLALLPCGHSRFSMT